MAENRTWKKLPDEEGRWWYWNGDGKSHLIIYEVMTPEETRYFPVGTGAWCDKMGGFWLKAEVPAPPTAVERADAEAVWLKRFQEVLAKDTAQVIADTQIDKERRGS